jgi:hypothetical protein
MCARRPGNSCAHAWKRSARNRWLPSQPVTVGLRVGVASYPHRRAETQDRTADAIVGELTNLVETTIVRSDSVRAADAAVEMRLVDRPEELPPFADTAVILRLEVTVTTSRWPITATPTLSEQVRAYVAAELGDLEQIAGARINVDVVSLVYGLAPDELPNVG